MIMVLEAVAGSIKSPTKAIRAKCLDCCCGSAHEVKHCTATDCVLYPFRFGKNPYRKAMSEEQKQAARERIEKMREEGKWQ